MDAGNLVPDEVTIGMAEDRLDQPDAANGFLLDGFPRNVAQAEALDEILAETASQLDGGARPRGPRGRGRQAHRRPPLCRNDSAHVFHVTYKPPKAEDVCDVCGGELYQRADDTEETVRKRLEVYHTRDRADHRLLQGAGPGGHDLGARQGGGRHRPRRWRR